MWCNFYNCTEQFCKSDTNYEPKCDTVDTVCTGLRQGCGLDGISIEAEVKAGPFHRGRGRGRGQIEADLLALQQATSFHFRSFIFVSSLAEDEEILSSSLNCI